MTALSEMQRNFVIAHNNAGGKNVTESARAAGYSDGTGIRAQAHQLISDPKVQAAIVEDMRARLTGNLAEVVEHATKIATTEGHSKQLDAIKFISHHGGMIEKQHIQVEHSLAPSFEEAVARAHQLAEAAGPAAVAQLQKIIDVQATEVHPTDPEYW